MYPMVTNRLNDYFIFESLCQGKIYASVIKDYLNSTS